MYIALQQVYQGLIFGGARPPMLIFGEASGPPCPPSAAATDPVYMLPLIPPLAKKTKLSWGVSKWVWYEHAPSRPTFKMLATALLLQLALTNFMIIRLDHS